MEDEELDDLLDEVVGTDPVPNKGRAAPVKRTKTQVANLLGAEQAEAQAVKTGAMQTQAQASAARLAQIVNLHIAGFSLEDIGAQIGASAAEVDRMLASDAQRYVRSQPALRVYVRNWVSSKYTAMLDTVWDRATDAGHRDNLEAQDRALRILDKMARLHGAEAPTQAEVKVEAAPETVEKMVAALAKAQGAGYDMGVFDIVDAEEVHEAVQESADALEVSGNRVGEPDGDEDL